LWYDIRSNEITEINGYLMTDYAKKHLTNFYQIINQDLLHCLLEPFTLQSKLPALALKTA